VYASAHEGKIPANRYRYQDGGHSEPTRFLVELGSHALAPDIDGDGVFTPGIDGDSGARILWGIRDSGFTWPRYHPDYMDSRSSADAPKFMHAEAVDSVIAEGSEELETAGYSYRLLPVGVLEEQFERLALTDAQRKRAFEKQVYWFKRVFGGDNGRSHKLLTPARPEIRRNAVGVKGVPSIERIRLAGSVLNLNDPGLFVGGRYTFVQGARYLPDVVFQVDGVLAKRKYLSSQLLLSYPIDAITSVMVGRALLTNSPKFAERQWDWVGAIEIRLGEMRFAAVTRSVGPISGVSKEFRLFRSF
jgi:hypothetical protein